MDSFWSTSSDLIIYVPHKQKTTCTVQFSVTEIKCLNNCIIFLISFCTVLNQHLYIYINLETKHISPSSDISSSFLKTF